MAKERVSSGLLLYTFIEGTPRVLLVHPGGPFDVKKDEGVWSIPKGEHDKGEAGLDCARREFREETGHFAPVEIAAFVSLGHIQQKGGKWVHAWAFEGQWNPAQFSSNTFTMEWPPKSGQQMRFPECDKAELFDLATAKVKIKDRQIPLLERLEAYLGSKATSHCG